MFCYVHEIRYSSTLASETDPVVDSSRPLDGRDCEAHRGISLGGERCRLEMGAGMSEKRGQ